MLWVSPKTGDTPADMHRLVNQRLKLLGGLIFGLHGETVKDVLGSVVGPFATSGETQISEILIDSRPTHIFNAVFDIGEAQTPATSSSLR